LAFKHRTNEGNTKKMRFKMLIIKTPIRSLLSAHQQQQ
jgi:hypothetical protein